MARGDGRRRAQRADEAADVEAGEVGDRRAVPDPGEIALHGCEDGDAFETAQGVEHRLVEKRRPEARGEGVQPRRRPGGELVAARLPPQAERGGRAGGDVEVEREGERVAQLPQIVLGREGGVLVEPLGRQHLGGAPQPSRPSARRTRTRTNACTASVRV